MKALFLFPGYGSHYVGMGKELYDSYRLVQEYFEIASNCLNVNFVKLCFASSEAELRAPQNVYVATFLVHLSIAAVLIQEGIQPSAVAGFADGEYAALAAVEALSLPDMFYIISKYSHLFDEYLQNVAVSAAEIVGISYNELLKLCVNASTNGEFATIAIKYTDTHYAVSGTDRAVAHIVAAAAEFEQASVTHLKPGVGLHSMLMDPIKEKLQMYMEKIDFKSISVPLISGIDGALVQNAVEIKERFLNQLVLPISCEAIVQAVQQYDLIIEIGNTSLLHDLIKKSYPQKTVITIKKNSDIHMLKTLIV